MRLYLTVRKVLKFKMKINDLKKVFTSKWLSVYEAVFNHNGKDGTWLFASRDANKSFDKPVEADAVVIVPFIIGEFDGVKRYVLIKEFRVPLGDYEYSFPAGLIDEGETPSLAAIREMKEETGLDIIRIGRISPPIYSSAGLTDEAVRIVFAECSGTPTNSNNESNECIEVEIMNLSEIDYLFNCNVKISARTWCIMDGIIKEDKSLRTIANHFSNPRNFD